MNRILAKLKINSIKAVNNIKKNINSLKIKFNKKQLKRQSSRVLIYDSQKYKTGKTISKISEDEYSLKNIRKLRNRRRRLLAWLIGILIMTLFIVVIIFNFINNIDVKIKYNGKENIVPNQVKLVYRKNIEQYFAHNPLERLSFLLNNDKLTNFIYQKNPEIKSITVDRIEPFLSKDIFLIEIRKPIAMIKSNERNIYVDNVGISFLDNNFSDPDIVLADKTGIKHSTSSINVSNRILTFTGEIISLLSESGYDIIDANLPPNTIHQIEIKLKGYNFPIKLTIDNNSTEQVASLIKTLKYINKNKLSIRYLDARIPGKIFYK